MTGSSTLAPSRKVGAPWFLQNLSTETQHENLEWVISRNSTYSPWRQCSLNSDCKSTCFPILPPSPATLHPSRQPHESDYVVYPFQLYFFCPSLVFTNPTSLKVHCCLTLFCLIFYFLHLIYIVCFWQCFIALWKQCLAKNGILLRFFLEYMRWKFKPFQL